MALERQWANMYRGLTLMTGFWFTRKEIPLRQCIWLYAKICSLCGLSRLIVLAHHLDGLVLYEKKKVCLVPMCDVLKHFQIGSYISTGIAQLPEDTTPERWEIIFYIVCTYEGFNRALLICLQLGSVTILWSVVVWFVLADSPSNASFLNHREKLIAVKRVAGNETGTKNKNFDMKQVWLGFTDIKAILLFISVFAAYAPLRR